MGELKDVKVFDLFGRRMERSEEAHFVTLVAKDNKDNIICWSGKLEQNEFQIDKEVYSIESFADIPVIEEFSEKGCLFCCAIRKQSPKEPLPTWPKLIQYKDTRNQDEQISIVCMISIWPKAKVTVLKTTLSNINDTGFYAENSFYRVGVM